jgi:DNA integrity scanning protein DisA with diadenylate cyclase activity/mannitol/fructose-specific phosphotransferase system IIA component (Ntr-type)
MPVQDYCDKTAVLFLKSQDKAGAFRELAEFFSSAYPSPETGAEVLLRKIVEREGIISTWIARGVAIPHVIMSGASHARVVLGVSRKGIPYDAPDGQSVHLLVLIVGGGADHLEVLRQTALRLCIPSVYENIIGAADEEEVYRAFTGEESVPEKMAEAKSDVSAACLRHACLLAKEVGAHRIFIHIDCLQDPEIFENLAHTAAEDLRLSPGALDRIVFVTISKYEELRKIFPEDKIIQIPFKGITRANQIELSVIFALSRALVHKTQLIISVVGQPYSGVLDTVQVTQVSREFGIFFSFDAEEASGDLERQVLVRAIEIAGELAEEGREGKPSGCIFVLGDYPQVRHHCQQMIINPFKGYAEGELNILDPSLKETVKELSKIDGAFIIGGDGAIISAGTYLRTRTPLAELPSGLGARHAAAAAITMVSRAIALALSESTRKLSVFKNGEKVMEL